MSQKIQYAPTTETARARAHRRTWPRVYTQHLATRAIFELCRGVHLSLSERAHATATFGPGWHTWTELPLRPAATLGAHRPARRAA